MSDTAPAGTRGGAVAPANELLAELEEALGTSLSAVRRGRGRIHARRAAFDPVDLRGTSDADEEIFDLIVD